MENAAVEEPDEHMATYFGPSGFDCFCRFSAAD